MYLILIYPVLKFLTLFLLPFGLKTLSPNNFASLNVSHNEIKGLIPNLSTNFINAFDIDLSSNYFQGPIPAFLGQSKWSIHLAKNFFTDTYDLLCQKIQIELSFLDLSNNSLSGELPDCWMNFNQLYILHLENNQFSGKIPTSIGFLNYLYFLHLENNSFNGMLPLSLKNCSPLVILDLGHNLLTGPIPSRIWYGFPQLGVLNLRGNQFNGSLPSSLCQLSNLQILDLSLNHLSGTIPKCFKNLSAMISMSESLRDMLDIVEGILRIDSVVFEWKTVEQRVGKTMNYYVLINLSDNKLQGKIPDGIYHLNKLVSLDLSRNNLSGIITSNIGKFTSLQLLDLSNNHLSGEIPESLTNISFLEILDLSNNNLSGRIPTGTQLQTFNTSSYLGNPFLCGEPLPYCLGDEPPTKTSSGENHQDEQGSDDIYPGLYISVVLGFVIGFWAICGTSVVKRSWRHAFFRFFDDMKDKLCVIWVFKVAPAWRKP